MPSLRFLMIYMLFFCTSLSSFAQDLETTLAAHESSVASLQYLSCHYVKTTSATLFSPAMAIHGQIKRGPSVLMISAKCHDFESLVYIRPGRCECLKSQTIMRGAKSERVSLSAVSTTLKTMIDVDPFRDMLFVFLDGALPSEKNGLRGVLSVGSKKAVNVASVGDEIVLSSSDSSIKVHLSTRNNFFASSVYSIGSHLGVVSERKSSVQKFFRSPNGVVVPEIMTMLVTNRKGDTTSTLQNHTLVLTEIDTQPFDESTVKPRYPRDTKVTNMIDGTDYIIDEDGRVLGDRKPTKLVAVLTASAEQKQLPTENEPARTGWWILPASLSLLATIAAFWLLLRRRQTS